MPDASNYFAKVIASERAVKPGELSQWPNAVIIGCPHCGRATKLCVPPFAFDAELRNMLLPTNTAAQLACGAVISIREGEFFIHSHCTRMVHSARRAARV
jgi:hypothetical protein